MDRIKGTFAKHEAYNVEDVIQQQWLQVCQEYELNKQLSCAIDKHLVISGNRLAMEVVMKNLLSNALKYSLGPDIRVTAQAEDQAVLVMVENACEGLADVDTGLLIKKYFRSDNVSGQRGTGLGLWICQTLCDVNDMKLTLTVQDGIFYAAVRITT